MNRTRTNGGTNRVTTSEKTRTVNQFQEKLSKLGAVSLVGIALFVVLFTGACDDEIVTEFVEIDVAPPAPQGVYTIRGDNMVTVNWLLVEAADFDRYRIYRGNDSLDGSVFNLVGESLVETFTDDPVSNGTRFYYAVTAVDQAGNESAQSAEYGGATPRRDGFNITLQVMDVNPNSSGFDLSAGNVVSFASATADFWIDRDAGGILYINADTLGVPSVGVGDIQDMGYTVDLDEIGAAPIPPTIDGWSALKYYEVVDGHTYVIWTQDDRYAKVRVSSQTLTSVTFDYAYQNGVARDGSGGEPELAPLVGGDTDSQKRTIEMMIDRSTGAHRTDTSQQPKNLGLSGAPQ
ncbi:MAG: hypothetical protein ACE5GA_05195 [Candidatus Zixiibacteriota bacterium]